eukprot:CFRG5202T1
MLAHRLSLKAGGPVLGLRVVPSFTRLSQKRGMVTSETESGAPQVHTTPSGTKYLRTPQERFDVVKGFDYTPKYKTVDGMQMAYLDEGSGKSGHTILCPHGEPSWGYLYKHMIAPLVDAGHRVVVPDLIGFGRSDKPVERSDYTYTKHVNWMKSFLDQMALSKVTVFAQDWGGLITLRIAGEEPNRYDRIVAANTALPVGKPAGEGFTAWLNASQNVPVLDCGKIIANAAVHRKLTEDDIAAFNAPFPNESYMAGAREFPILVPITPQHASVKENMKAWEGLVKWEKPLLALWGAADPVLGGLDGLLQQKVPGAAGQPHKQFTRGGHFLQFEYGEELASLMNEWLKK